MTDAAPAWLYLIAQAKKGPISTNTMVMLLGEKLLPASTLVWRAGMREWTPASKVPELWSHPGASPGPAPRAETLSPPRPATQANPGGSPSDIVTCPSCGKANRVPRDRTEKLQRLRCGNCKNRLATASPAPEAGAGTAAPQSSTRGDLADKGSDIVSCPSCGKANRVPRDRTPKGPTLLCGSCKRDLAPATTAPGPTVMPGTQGTPAKTASAPARRAGVATDLHRNPFFVLGVTTRDHSSRIVERADEMSLSLDGNACSQARAALTNPRKRLAAEIAWMPGIAPGRAIALLNRMESDLPVEGAPSLVLANLMSAGIERLNPERDMEEWERRILGMVDLAASIDAEDVLVAINEDRAIAAFPSVSSMEAVEQEITERQSHYKAVVSSALNRLPHAKLVSVMNSVVMEATANGEEQAPLLVDEMVDSYELTVQPELQRGTETVRNLIGRARAGAPAGEAAMNSILDQLDEAVRAWDRVAQPIQLSMKSRGQEHEMSHDLAREVRSLGVNLVNEHDMLECGKRTTGLLQEVFAELPEVVERLGEDAAALDALFRKRKKARHEAAEWERSITFRAELGLVFKDTLAISPQGVQWKDRVFPLETITRVRWGSVVQYVNGIRSGTTYTISFGDNRQLATVHPRKEEVFLGFQARLWKAVVPRIMTEIVTALGGGQKVTFGDMVLDDRGAELTRHKFFGNERAYGTWSQLHVWHDNGAFVVGLKDDPKVYSSLSYLGADNTHLVEALLRIKLDNSDPRMSSLL